MPEDEYNQTQTEAVAIFHDGKALQAAVDELLTKGFDHAELSVLANEEAVKAKFGHGYASTAELEDDPDVLRSDYVPNEDIGTAQGGIIAVAAYFPAVIAGLVVASSGGTLLGVVAVAAIAGSAGAAVGATLARFVGAGHARHMQEHLARGGLLLWVRTHDSEHEKTALDVLRRHSGEDVHLHELPAPMRPVVSIPTRRPALSFGRPN